MMRARTTKIILALGLLALLVMVSVASAAASVRSTDLNAPGASVSQQERIHVVRRGETLANIAWRYGVSVNALVRLNGIRNPNLIYVGQRLRIPGPAATATPRPQPTKTPVAATATPPVCVCPQAEAIIINSPAQGVTITNPVRVTGIGAAFEQQIGVRVLDQEGKQIGAGVAFITGELGQRGPFSGTITFTVPATPQIGRIQVFSTSPRDGAIEHLSSVVVNLGGAGAAVAPPAPTAIPVASELDILIAAVKAALESKDYTTLQASMTADNFLMGFYLSEGQSLTPAQAIEQLRVNYLGPGEVKVDLGKDAMKTIGDRASFGPTVRAVIFSTGWGAQKKDDAFLVFEEIEGSVYWSAMLYVRDDLRDY
ncbi:MAG: LysM peptidoglycan-binding domain-containing protein [Anaerolineae bacterium]|nr:LysM peptidoglycan-binding domain-containing protein [Anaerolineae bacterium]